MRTTTRKTTSGKLRTPIEIQTNTEFDRSGDGGVIPRWVGAFRTFANIEPLTGQQLERAQQIAGKVTHQVTVRYMPGITRQMRVKHNDRYLTINAVLNSGEQNIELKLLCSEAV